MTQHNQKLSTNETVGPDGRLPVLCIVGPTATGKSDLGLRIAKAVGGEILSADSMQVYRGMDIGTAKLTPGEMDGVPHHLIDLVNPDVPFTVADWTREADSVIHRLHQAGKLPIVVGGTGLYIRSIVEDMNFAVRPGSEAIREKWETFAEEHGAQRLHDELRVRDSMRAAVLHPNDVRRVVRALEVFEMGDEPMSSDYDWTVKGGRYSTLQFGLTMKRETLYHRINQRVDKMVRQGLFDEVKGLLERGYNGRLRSMQAIGYKEMLSAVQGDVTVGEATRLIAQATRRFAKRQLSWFRRDPRIDWVHLDALFESSHDDQGHSGQGRCDMERIFKAASSLAAGITRSDRE